MDEMVSIEAARPRLGEIVDRARLADETTVITRNGKPAAVVVNVDWYEQAKALIAATEESHTAAAKKDDPGGRRSLANLRHLPAPTETPGDPS